jgi:hypothetical protein
MCYYGCEREGRGGEIAGIVFFSIVCLFWFCFIVLGIVACVINCRWCGRSRAEPPAQNADLVHFRAQGRQQGETSEERTVVVKR